MSIMPYAMIALFSMIPGFEGRYAILFLQPLYQTPIVPTYIIATIFGFLPSAFIILTIEKFLIILKNSKSSAIANFGIWLNNKIDKAKTKINKRDEIHPEDTKLTFWSFIALMVFVSIPLPGTGVWTGSMAAGALKLRLRNALPPIFIGNIIAGLITTLIAAGLIPAIF